VLRAEGGQLGLDLSRSHTALQTSELLTSDGGFQFDAVDGFKEENLKKKKKAKSTCRQKILLVIRDFHFGEFLERAP